nr:TIGR01906 family membrane protein [Tissierella sp.]
MKRLLAIIMVIAVSLTLLVLSIEIGSYNKEFFMDKYKEYRITEVTGKSLDELEPITENLILYLKGGDNSLLMPHFNEREILHMEDVRDLFDLARMIKYISIALIIGGFVYFWKKKDFLLPAKTLLYGLFSNHLLFILMGILAYKDFNKYFTYFHKIFFTNDLWILDPSTDLMIQMLPEEFFSSMAVTIMVTFLVTLGLAQIICYIYIIKKKKNYKTLKSK